MVGQKQGQLRLPVNSDTYIVNHTVVLKSDRLQFISWWHISFRSSYAKVPPHRPCRLLLLLVSFQLSPPGGSTRPQPPGSGLGAKWSVHWPSQPHQKKLFFSQLAFEILDSRPYKLRNKSNCHVRRHLCSVTTLPRGIVSLLQELSPRGLR